MKTLVTHINPHLDDIFAIWLYKKFHPQFEDSKLEFISANRDSAKDESVDKIYFGTGGGKFDEHFESKLGECAGSLVWKDILSSHLAPKDEIEKKALEELVEWNRLIDTGQAPSSDFSEYSLQSILRPPVNDDDTSKKSVELGEEILDKLFAIIKNKKKAEADWEKRIEFESSFGNTVAIKSDAVGRAFVKQKKGANLFLMLDPKYGSVQFFTPKDLDLEPIYKKIKQIDPEADWFLHQSHHMVICGSGSSPDSKISKLSFEQLIDIVKSFQ